LSAAPALVVAPESEDPLSTARALVTAPALVVAAECHTALCTASEFVVAPEQSGDPERGKAATAAEGEEDEGNEGSERLAGAADETAARQVTPPLYLRATASRSAESAASTPSTLSATATLAAAPVELPRPPPLPPLRSASSRSPCNRKKRLQPPANTSSGEDASLVAAPPGERLVRREGPSSLPICL